MFSLNYNTADPTKPSFFEMYAQSELASKIKPAMSYIFSVFAIRNPALMTPLNYFDEIYHSIQFLIERFYLINYGYYYYYSNLFSVFSDFFPIFCHFNWGGCQFIIHG